MKFLDSETKTLRSLKNGRSYRDGTKETRRFSTFYIPRLCYYVLMFVDTEMPRHKRMLGSCVNYIFVSLLQIIFFTNSVFSFSLKLILDGNWVSTSERSRDITELDFLSFLQACPLYANTNLLKKLLQRLIIPSETVINLSTFRLCFFIAAGCLKPKKARLMSSSLVDGRWISDGLRHFSFQLKHDHYELFHGQAKFQ